MMNKPIEEKKTGKKLIDIINKDIDPKEKLKEINELLMKKRLFGLINTNRNQKELAELNIDAALFFAIKKEDRDIDIIVKLLQVGAKIPENKIQELNKEEIAILILASNNALKSLKIGSISKIVGFPALAGLISAFPGIALGSGVAVTGIAASFAILFGVTGHLAPLVAFVPLVTLVPILPLGPLVVPIAAAIAVTIIAAVTGLAAAGVALGFIAGAVLATAAGTYLIDSHAKKGVRSSINTVLKKLESKKTKYPKSGESFELKETTTKKIQSSLAKEKETYEDTSPIKQKSKKTDYETPLNIEEGDPNAQVKVEKDTKPIP